MIDDKLVHIDQNIFENRLLNSISEMFKSVTT